MRPANFFRCVRRVSRSTVTPGAMSLLSLGTFAYALRVEVFRQPKENCVATGGNECSDIDVAAGNRSCEWGSHFFK